MSEDISPSSVGPGEWALQVNRKELVAALRAVGRSTKKMSEPRALLRRPWAQAWKRQRPGV